MLVPSDDRHDIERRRRPPRCRWIERPLLWRLDLRLGVALPGVCGEDRLLDCDDETSDEEIAAAPLADEQHIGVLNDVQFGVLLSRNKVGEFLSYAARCCGNPETAQADIDDYISALEAIPATHSYARRKRRIFAGKEMGNYVVANETAA